MPKGKKTGGRRPGSRNKLTAGAKEALEHAFIQLGGVQALVQWGQANPDGFYPLWGKLIPKDIKLDPTGNALILRVVKE